MASTRSVISPPVFAENASTSIPPTPIAGVSYRDPVAGPSSSPDGWPYSEVVNSAEFNQVMYQITTLVGLVDKKGVPGWSDQVDYTEAAIAFGSDGALYLWLQASGPNNGGARDPISNPTYWAPLPKGFATGAEIIAGTVADKAVSPFGLLASFLGAGGIAANDYVKIPYRDKNTGVRREFILQWGSYSQAANGDLHVLPITFPNAHIFTIANDNSNSLSTFPIGTSAFLVGSFRTYSDNTSPGAFQAISIGY